MAYVYVHAAVRYVLVLAVNSNWCQILQSCMPTTLAACSYVLLQRLYIRMSIDALCGDMNYM